MKDRGEGREVEFGSGRIVLGVGTEGDGGFGGEVSRVSSLSS